MVIFISKIYFDYMGQESVSKLIYKFKQHQLIIPNHCTWIVCWLFYVPYWYKSFLEAFSSSWRKRPSNTFSICLIYGKLYYISIVFLSCFNRRNYKISVAIILCIVNSHITFHEGQEIFCPSVQYCFYISNFFFYFFLHFVTPKFFVDFYLFQIRTSFSSASSCFLTAQEKNLI